MNKVEELLKDKALVRGGIYLFSKEYAKKFVLECKKQSIIILGIDGFFIDEKTTQPSQENSIDFSEHPFNESIYEKAINFLEARDGSLYFEIVCPE